MTMHKIATISDYRLEEALGSECTPELLAKFTSAISDLLPDWAAWCGEEVLAPIDYTADDLDLDSIIEKAFEAVCNC